MLMTKRYSKTQIIIRFVMQIIIYYPDSTENNLISENADTNLISDADNNIKSKLCRYILPAKLLDYFLWSN